ncbi:dynein light chain Tctex-type protein 2B [Chiloscyllium plagiosum]|uniref:dynein light chain Tctex-type protein 2B n=1 Tax=Chiloscyllium plagiosum TaxID=36176 RepID=UPI001CB7EBBF|nr:dynein light chain Tctex-type protein 2B [Chiloscyllium plagiosum]
MGSCSFGEAERLKKPSSLEAMRLARSWCGHLSQGWAPPGGGSELHRSRSLSHRSKEKRREKAERLSQRQRPNADPNSSSSSSSATNLYVPRAARTFSAEEARAAIRPVLEARLKDAKYEPHGSALAVVELAECVKKAVKALGYERYKIICYLALGATTSSGLCCSSRAVWSPTVDTYAEVCFQNDSLFALCLVFAVYHE